MKKLKLFLILAAMLSSILAASGYAMATSSEGFRTEGQDVFDDWDISRTRSDGADGFYQVVKTGFRPVIAYESLGEEASTAYHLGEQMAEQYPDRIQRAEKIFYYVRDRVRYTPDKDQFEYDEFAQNADELADKIAQNGFGHGDCEDSAILLAVMYKGAGYRSAIAIAPGHTAAMVYLPEYKKGSNFKMDGEEGWFWAEATGRRNTLGWVAKEFIDGKFKIKEHTCVEASLNNEILGTAINEFVITSVDLLKPIDFRVLVDEVVTSVSLADGLIVSTAIGSTGHSLSSGGAVVDADLKNLQISWINPINLAIRPLILGSHREIKIRCATRINLIKVVIDGQRSIEFSPPIELTFRASKKPVKFYRKRTFMERLRQHLHPEVRDQKY